MPQILLNRGYLYTIFYYERLTNINHNNHESVKTPTFRTYVKELNQNSPDFSEENIEQMLLLMPNNKASGPSKLPIELFKFWINDVKYTLSIFFKLIWKFKHTPSNWNLTLIFPLYKNKGDKNLASNYRPIALTEHVRKLFEKIIL